MKRTVISMLQNAAEKFNEKPYLTDKTDQGWKSISFKDADKLSDYAAIAYMHLGLKYDDKVSIIAEGRSAWIISEFGLLKTRCVSVPLSVKLLPEEALFRINHSESKAIIISKNNVSKLFPIAQKIQYKDFKIFYLDDDDATIAQIEQETGAKRGERLFTYNELINKGKELYEQYENKLSESINNIEEEDVVTISYTSGTTGNPKGIMLTHLNYYGNSVDAQNLFNLEQNKRTLIILPVDHSFAHTVGNYISLLVGMNLAFVDARGGSMKTLRNIPINLKEIKPHLLLTVPALSGNFMKKIIEAIDEKGGFVKWLFDTGMKAGMKINRDGYHKATGFTKLINYLPYKLADVIVFKKVRQIFGGELEFCIGGGALLDIRQQRFFYTLGTPVFQGYGLTEATPIISTNTRTIHKLGSSGKVLPGITCKIIKSDGTEAKTGEKGEIVIKGLNVMKGYFKNPEATQQTIKNGWLYTGDMGYFDQDGFLIVTGREKALLISQDGEKYSPEEIEEAIMNTSEYIFQVMLYNDHSKYTTAIATIEKNKLKALAEKTGNDIDKIYDAVKKSFLKFKNEPEYKGKFPEKWIPSVFAIVEEPFSEQNKMVNSTMKMVRFKITEVYRQLIDEMYNLDSQTIDKKNKEVLKKILIK